MHVLSSDPYLFQYANEQNFFPNELNLLGRAAATNLACDEKFRSGIGRLLDEAVFGVCVPRDHQAIFEQAATLIFSDVGYSAWILSDNQALAREHINLLISISTIYTY